MKQLFFLAVIFITTSQPLLNAQSVSINNTGAIANQSALLDVDVSSLTNKKGLLAPRMTVAQRTAMSPLPAAAQGLLVYQTDGVQGFYYNTSLTTTPNWILVNNSGTGTRWDQFTSPAGNLSLAHGANTTSFSFNGVTGGNAFSLSSNSLVSGNLFNLSSSSTAGIASGVSTVLNINRTGANTNSDHVAYGVASSVSNTGTNSINRAGYFNASGGNFNYGVYGTATISGNANFGGYFSASGAISNNIGLVGTTSSGTGSTGISGSNSSTEAGPQYGIIGRKAGNTGSGTGYAIYGDATGTGASNIGGYFSATGATNNYAAIFNQGNVGIGTTTPAYTLDVTGSLARTGNFVNTASSANSYGLYASCSNTAGFGTGLWGKGGIYGVVGDATLPGTGSRVGVHGVAGTGTSNMGVFGDAFGGTAAYGIYARALGATTNWAGYFEGGNVYIQNTLGIGTTTPNADALLHLNVGASLSKGFLVTGSSSGGSVPGLGAGKRMMFYPAKAAFRAGSVEGTEWDNANVGEFSMAFGDRTIASGQSASAIGQGTIANGYTSTAMGTNTIASGGFSTATGYSTNAIGDNSFSMGIYTSAGGYSSTAFGSGTDSKGYASTTLGMYNDQLLAADQPNFTNTTPLFIVGNGNDFATRSNAFVVQKNAKVYIDPSNKNDGTLAGNALFFGQYNVTGEAIGSKRTATGNAFGLDFFTSYINRMSIANNGNVGIGTEVPISTLHVKGTINVFDGGLNNHTGNFWQGNSNVDGMEFASNGSGDAYIGIQRSTGAGLNISRFSGAGQLVTFFVGGSSVGNIATSGANITFNSTSDMRLKENIIPTKASIYTLMEINVKDYHYKADIKKETQTGFLAQELYKVFPQAVTPGGENANINPWTIDYSKLTPLVVKSIQEQQIEMEALKKTNDDQRQLINQLNQRLEKLEILLKK